MLERRDYRTRPFATPMQKDHARLAAAWKRVKAERKAQGHELLQKDLALKYGVTEGLIGHYLRGREPLNLKWQFRFAEFLGLPVLEIWPDFQHKDLLSSGLPADALALAFEYLEKDDRGKEAMRSLAAALPNVPDRKQLQNP